MAQKDVWGLAAQHSSSCSLLECAVNSGAFLRKCADLPVASFPLIFSVTTTKSHSPYSKQCMNDFPLCEIRKNNRLFHEDNLSTIKHLQEMYKAPKAMTRVRDSFAEGFLNGAAKQELHS